MQRFLGLRVSWTAGVCNKKPISLSEAATRLCTWWGGGIITNGARCRPICAVRARCAPGGALCTGIRRGRKVRVLRSHGRRFAGATFTARRGQALNSHGHPAATAHRVLFQPQSFEVSDVPDLSLRSGSLLGGPGGCIHRHGEGFLVVSSMFEVKARGYIETRG